MYLSPPSHKMVTTTGRRVASRPPCPPLRSRRAAFTADTTFKAAEGPTNRPSLLYRTGRQTAEHTRTCTYQQRRSLEKEQNINTNRKVQ